MANMDISYECCICRQTFVGFGNNPWPVNDDINARCCNQCNADVVIPARLMRMCTENRDGTEQS